ncbi:MAG TPA: IclR family transcriptional regulator [Candidatus Brevibacterium intestinavium]|nr:IclR family transcriptional regulator [Candidatus Brevibacterium intestinavium]
MAPPTLISSVQRALRLLETVAASADPIPAKKLARLTGLPLPTTYHLLRTLVYEGYLRKAENGYVIGPSATASGRSPLQSLHPRIQPVLRSLRDELGGATYLSMYDHGEIRLVDIADGPHAQCVDLWVGVHEAGHATAFGKAILAGLDPELRDDYINRHDLHDLTPNTITNRNALERRLADPPEIWSDSEEYLLGTYCLAASIRTSDLVASIAVSLPTHRGRSDSQAHALHRAAHRLRRTIGAPSITM